MHLLKLLLLCGITTIDEKVKAGDKFVLDNENNTMSDLFRSTETSERMQ